MALLSSVIWGDLARTLFHIQVMQLRFVLASNNVYIQLPLRVQNTWWAAWTFGWIISFFVLVCETVIPQFAFFLFFMATQLIWCTWYWSNIIQFKAHNVIESGELVGFKLEMFEADQRGGIVWKYLYSRVYFDKKATLSWKYSTVCWQNSSKRKPNRGLLIEVCAERKPNRGLQRLIWK